MDLADLPMDYARTGQIVPAQFLKTQRQTLRSYLEAIVEGIYIYRTRAQVVLEVYKEQGLKDPNAARQTYEKILKKSPNVCSTGSGHTRNEHFIGSIVFQIKCLIYLCFFASVRKMSECFLQ